MRSFFFDHNGFATVVRALSVATLLLFPGCDTTVDVLQPSDQYRYSLYGVLDVAADTQVIRVDPLSSPNAPGASSSVDAAVVLQNLESGEEISLQDSLTILDADSTTAHNFWTTHPIQPSTKYRIAVKKENTVLTTGTTTTPAQAPSLNVGQPILLPCTYPTPTIPDRQSENTFVVFARGAPQIAAAIIQYPILQPSGEDTLRTWVSSNHYDKVSDEGDRFKISVFYRDELISLHPDPPSGSPVCPGESYFFRPAARMIVSAGGPQWPEWQSASIDSLARPDLYSNVQGGHGFVGGIYTDTLRVPFAERLP